MAGRGKLRPVFLFLNAALALLFSLLCSRCSGALQGTESLADLVVNNESQKTPEHFVALAHLSD